MTLQPAPEVLLRHGDHAVTLRASLRAAVTIDNMPGGIPGTWEQISRWSYSAIRAVILATTTDRLEAEKLLAAASTKPLCAFLGPAQAACLAVIAAALATGDDAETPPSHGSTSAGAEMPLRVYFKSLYQYATGWLGWTPADTWAASPAEIEAAFAAHVDRLVMITPGASREGGEPSPAPSAHQYTPERLRQIEEQGFDPEFDRESLRALKARHNA